MYQQILLYACPAGTMQWEFTDDYSIVNASEKHGETTLEPTRRFYIVKHFCNLIPQGASALATESDHPKALFTGFRGKTRSKERVYTFHISNNGAARKATVTGLPKELENRKLHAVRTGPEEMFQKTDPATVRNGKIELELREHSLLTLTTQAVE
jgi:hypothetical protein